MSGKTDLFNRYFNLSTGYININKLLSLNNNKDKISFAEIYDSNLLTYILNNIELVKEQYRDECRNLPILHSYLENSNIKKKIGTIKVNYSQKDNGLYGRYQANCSLSGQGMVREVRHTIFHKFMKDMDIKNCHPTIILWLCDNMNIKSIYLREYINNRENIINELLNNNLDLDKEYLKTTFLVINNGGSKKYKNIKNKTDFIKNYYNELKTIRTEITNKLYYFKTLTKDSKLDNSFSDNQEYNIEGKTMAHICMFIENQLLIVITKYFKDLLPKKEFKNIILCFDGIMIPSHLNIDFDDCIQDLENKFERYGIPIKLSMKELIPLNLPNYNTQTNYRLINEDEPTFNIPTIEDIKSKNIKIEDQEEQLKLISNEIKLETKLIKSSYTDKDIADYFISTNNNFKVYNNKVYFFNGSYWIISNENQIYKAIDKIYWYILDIINKYFKESDSYTKYVKNLLKLRSITQLSNIYKTIKIDIETSIDLWDFDKDLLAFENGIYDLKTDKFRNGKYEDFITMIIPYEYHPSNQQDTDFIYNHLRKIMPKKEELHLLLLIMASILSGRTLEKFSICTGSGRNGKDALFTYLLPAVLGPLYYRCNANAITQTTKGDQNQSLANLNKKKMVLFNEPNIDETIKSALTKEITGGKEIAFRGLYSTDTKVNLMLTTIMICNSIPLLDHVDNAMFMRLIVFKFNSTFQAKQYMIDNQIAEGENNIFEGTDYVKSDEFLNKYKLPMMNLLLDYFKEFRQNGFNIQKIPESIQKNSNKYLEDSDEFTGWFKSEYKQTNNKGDVLKLKDIWNYYKLSEYYNNLTKKEKRMMSYSKFSEDLKINPNLKMFYHDSQIYINEIKYNKCITNFIKK